MKITKKQLREMIKETINEQEKVTDIHGVTRIDTGNRNEEIENTARAMGEHLLVRVNKEAKNLSKKYPDRKYIAQELLEEIIAYLETRV